MIQGLNNRQVEESRLKHGHNILTPPEKESLWSKFLDKFTDPLIVILLIAAVLSIGISCYEYFYLNAGSKVFFEPVGIIMAILLATGLAFIFEVKADKEFKILNQVNDSEPVKVIRNGNTTAIAKSEVVVGDVVILHTGDEVPADAELIEATELKIDESTLTGEPVCEKYADKNATDPNATYPSYNVMRGTKVMEGHCICKVFAVGDKTENGKVYKEAQIDNSVKTPLNEQLDKLGKLISYASYSIAALVVVGRIVSYIYGNATDGISGNFEIEHFISYTLQSFMMAVTLIVVAVPEGLPMAVTLSLAYSMRRMLKTNNLVRKMHACETMGATTVICTDKTGTLTQNKMQVAETHWQSGIAQDTIAEAIAVNSTAMLDLSNPDNPQAIGNPTEGALLLYLHRNGNDYNQLRNAAETLDEVPFSTEKKYMQTTVKSANGHKVTYTKGAPEVVLQMCGLQDKAIEAELLECQSKAMRTLGFAEQTEGQNMRFMGFVAITDPIRDDVPAAVEECTNAGIAIKIVTGDTVATARQIGKEIGLWTETDNERNIITGTDFAALTDEEALARLKEIKIISRARPLDKKRLVELLQKQGEVVAVTGDGTNDAPALKAAHVGLSMGDGTSVAKEASDITIIDNSFASIGRAVMWGRSLYLNIQRFILFQMTVNVAACLVVLIGAFYDTDAPLTVTQMLWVNLIMDTFAAMALASLPPSESVMQSKPRDRKDFIISGSMAKNIIGTGVAFTIVLLGILFVMHHVTIEKFTDLFAASGPFQHVGAYEVSLFFTLFVMLQFWNMFNAKAYATNQTAFRFKNCDGFIFIAALILFGQIAIVQIGGEFFNVTPLAFTDWLWAIGTTAIVLIIGETGRMMRNRLNFLRNNSY